MSTLQRSKLDLEQTLATVRTTSDAHVAELRQDRNLHLRELGEARIRVQDLEAQLSMSRGQVKAAQGSLESYKLEQDAARKEQAAEADRLLRDHVAEADG